MPPPINYSLPVGVEAHRIHSVSPSLSAELVKLLVDSRSNYDWPAGTGARNSQQTILSLELSISQLMQALNEDNAHSIISMVSEWAGNNVPSHNNILQATPKIKSEMLNSLRLSNAAQVKNAINALSNLPGISLVIASKIFRFCCPTVGGAVDRHTSYFFNSLAITTVKGGGEKATNFRREWSDGKHIASRLAIYNQSSYTRNLDEFINVYLPLLSSMAEALNAIPSPYNCAATGEEKNWRPTDVEMAAYYWGACKGER